MKRLTARNENGEAYYKRCYESPCDGTGEACDDCNFIGIKVCEALAAYEDNGITPEQMREISRLYQAKCEELNKVNAELAECKRLEEQGLLLRLPCKIGGIVWKLHKCSGGGRVPDWYEIYEARFSLELFGDFGKIVFLTKEEAEQALAKMKGYQIPCA